MSVARRDLNACVGCRKCVEVCPMDVFYFSEEAGKSVMAFPEACQSCGQCYLHCLGGSLVMSTLQASYLSAGGRGLRTFADQKAVYAPAEAGGWGH